MYYFRIMSTITAITISPKPNHANPSTGTKDTNKIPNPKPNKPCITTWGVKQDIIFLFIFMDITSFQYVLYTRLFLYSRISSKLFTILSASKSFSFLIVVVIAMTRISAFFAASIPLGASSITIHLFGKDLSFLAA